MALALQRRNPTVTTLTPRDQTRGGRLLPDYRLDEIKLDPAGASVPRLGIGPLLTDGTLTLTMAGATTLELVILDTDKVLLTSDYLTGWTWGTDADHHDEAAWIRDGRAIGLTLDDLAFRLARVEKRDGRQVMLEFEDEGVAMLRAFKGARSATRGTATSTGITRAQFVKMLCDEAKVPSYIPELLDPQKIQSSQAATASAGTAGTTSQRAAKGQKGLNRAAGLTVKGQAASPENFRVAQIGLDVGNSLNAPRNALIALIAAYIDENGMTNHPGGGGSSSGSLQLLASTAASLHVNPLDIKGCATLFFKRGFSLRGAIASARKGEAPADIATHAQGNAAGASAYAPFVGEATKWVNAYAPGAGLTGGTSVTVDKAFHFSRGANETSWDAIQRLAQEVGWRAFMRKGVLWYVSDDALRSAQVALTMWEHREDRPSSVDSILPVIDLRARNLVADMTAAVHIDRWTAMPGMVAAVEEEGPADGRWLVQDVTRPLWDELASVTLTKPTGKLAEPAPPTASVQFGATGTLAAGAAGQAQRLYDECKRISDAGGPYVWGGGHGGSLANASPKSGLDCSSSCSLALYRANLFQGKTQSLVSGAFNTWGAPGPGKYFTVWYHSGHVFIDLTVPGRSGKRFDTSPHGSGGSGPRIRNAHRSTAGFSSRHFPGL